MAYFGADIKNIIAEILEAKKSKGGFLNAFVRPLMIPARV